MLSPNILISSNFLLYFLSLINIYYFSYCFFSLMFYLISSFPLINWKLSNASTKQSPCENRHSDFESLLLRHFGTLTKRSTSFWRCCQGLYFSYLVAIHFQFVRINFFILYFLFIYNFNFIH